MRVPVKVGYGSYLGAAPMAAEVFHREVAQVEAAGFDAMFFSEHHGVQGYVSNPLLVAATVLARTSVLRAGPMPMLLPLHDPVRVAEDAALIDFLSGGRLIMGLGAGYLARDFEQAGVPLDRLGTRYEEGLEVLRRTWRGDTSPYEGQIIRVPALDPLIHRPVQDPGPPVWNAGSSRAGTRRAARLADGLVLDSLRPTAQVRELVELYREACREAGREPGTVAVMRRMWFGDVEETERFLATMEAEYKHYVDLAGNDQSPWITDLRNRGVTREAVQDRVFTGAPEKVADELGDWAAEVGASYVIAKFHWMGDAGADLGPQFERAASMCAILEGASTQSFPATHRRLVEEAQG